MWNDRRNDLNWINNFDVVLNATEVKSRKTMKNIIKRLKKGVAEKAFWKLTPTQNTKLEINILCDTLSISVEASAQIIWMAYFPEHTKFIAYKLWHRDTIWIVDLVTVAF